MASPRDVFGMAKKSDEPWEKPAPKKSKHTKLTPASKAKAKASAKKAGRSYPNLVDNMNAAKAQEKQPAAKKKSSPARKSGQADGSSSKTKKARPRAKQKAA